MFQATGAGMTSIQGWAPRPLYPESGMLLGPSPLLPADVHTHRGGRRQDVRDQGQKPLQDQFQGRAASLHVASQMEGWSHRRKKERRYKYREVGRGPGATRAHFHHGLSDLVGTAVPHTHVGVDPGGSFPLSLRSLPSLPIVRGWYGFPTRTSHTCFAEASRSAARPWCTGPASTGSWGEGQGWNVSSRLQLLGQPRPTTTHAFWLTMFRRSTTTDRSLMATAESTDVCANRQCLSEGTGRAQALPGHSLRGFVGG